MTRVLRFYTCTNAACRLYRKESHSEYSRCVACGFIKALSNIITRNY